MKKQAIVIFGEDDNDRKAVKELILALHPNARGIKILMRRKPLVLMKGRTRERTRSNAQDIANIIRAERVRHDVKFILAHQDCDDVEPAHLRLSKEITDSMEKFGVKAVPVTPAFEMEAWWFLWPDAVIAFNSNWNRPSMSGKHVGMVRDAKEALMRAVTKGNKRAQSRPYRESDAPLIAEKVRELGIVNKKDASSDSFELFVKHLRNACESLDIAYSE